jgi:hypothetical protein
MLALVPKAVVFARKRDKRLGENLRLITSRSSVRIRLPQRNNLPDGEGNDHLGKDDMRLVQSPLDPNLRNHEGSYYFVISSGSLAQQKHKASRLSLLRRLLTGIK